VLKKKTSEIIIRQHNVSDNDDDNDNNDKHLALNNWNKSRRIYRYCVICMCNVILIQALRASGG